MGRWQEWNGTAGGSWEHDECSLARGRAVLVGPFPRSFEMVARVDDEADIGRSLFLICDVVGVVVDCWLVGFGYLGVVGSPPSP